MAAFVPRSEWNFRAAAVIAAAVCAAFFVGAVEEKDRVFGDDAHQHDEADHAHHVQGIVRQEEREKDSD